MLGPLLTLPFALLPAATGSLAPSITAPAAAAALALAAKAPQHQQPLTLQPDSAAAAYPDLHQHALAQTTVAIADFVEVLVGFGNSPAILLIPIGAGSLVAGIIIYILWKSAE